MRCLVLYAIELFESNSSRILLAPVIKHKWGYKETEAGECEWLPSVSICYNIWVNVRPVNLLPCLLMSDIHLFDMLALLTRT